MRLLVFVSLTLVTIAAGGPPAPGSTPPPGPDPALPTVSGQALRQLTDNRTRQAMIAESMRQYRGECACPSQVDRHGRTCGKRAGKLIGPNHPKPFCTPIEISDEQVKAWREKRQR